MYTYTSRNYLLLRVLIASAFVLRLDEIDRHKYLYELAILFHRLLLIINVTG